jgi:hypothetical protein
MGFINALRFIIKGEKSKILIKEGWEVEYKYSHLTELFNPVSMFSELNYKLLGVPKEACFLYKGSFSFLKDLWNEDQVMHLKISAKMTVMGFPLIINRHIKKMDDRPTTVYKIWYNKKLLAVWHKKYDFGREYDADIKDTFTKDKLSSDGFLTIKNFGSNQILGQNEFKERCLIEKFVHTHILMIHDIKTFESLCEILHKKN